MTEFNSSSTYDQDQSALAERLSRQARFSHDIANTAFNDVATLTTSVFGLGLVESAPANLISREQLIHTPTVETIRSLGATPLSELMMHNTTSTEQALRYQDTLAA